MSFIEFKNHGKHFKRVDAELGGSEGDASQPKRWPGFSGAASGKEKLEVKVQSLGSDALPAMILESEESRRMQEMRKQFERMQGSGDDKIGYRQPVPAAADPGHQPGPAAGRPRRWPWPKSPGRRSRRTCWPARSTTWPGWAMAPCRPTTWPRS